MTRKQKFHLRSMLNQEIRFECACAMESDDPKPYMNSIPTYIKNVAGFLFMVGAVSDKEYGEFLDASMMLWEDLLYLTT